MDGLVSVIIPVYNVEQYLEVCLKSIMYQTYKNIEIILVDDGSTDVSGAICDAYAQKDSRIYVIHKENGGLSEARNIGVAVSKGKYVMFVDSDDMVAPNLVEYLYNLMCTYNATISICDLLHIFPGEEINFCDETEHYIFNSEQAVCEMFYQKTFLVAACGKLYDRRCFENIFFPVGMLFEDSAVMYKILDQAQNIVYGNAKLYGYMHREGSITTKKFSKRDCDILTICAEIIEYMSHRSEALQVAAKAYQTSGAFRIYMNAPRNGEYDSEINCSKKIIESNWKRVFICKHVRFKMRMAILMYILARPLMPIVYKKVNRWK